MIINEKYEIYDTKLGTGAFSVVYTGIELYTGNKVAIKKINFVNGKISKDKIDFEINIMKKMDHVNIIKYIDVVKSDDIWYIIMEYCNAKTLQEVVEYHREMQRKNINFNKEENSCYYLNQLKEAFKYIRKFGLIHRDIKPANILLFNPKITFNGYNSDSGLILKLADFGLSKIYDDTKTKENMINTLCGSPMYMAPELFIERNYSTKADLWSYGIVMYELLFGHLPTKANNINQLVKILSTKDIDFHLARNLTPECQDLLLRLLLKDQDNRIEWDDFFNHEWFIKKDTISISIPINIPQKIIYSNKYTSAPLTTNERLSGSNLTQFQSSAKRNMSDDVETYYLLNKRKSIILDNYIIIENIDYDEKTSTGYFDKVLKFFKR